MCQLFGHEWENLRKREATKRGLLTMAALDRAEPLADPPRAREGDVMRTLRLSLVGTVILVLLGGLGGAATAQDEATGAVEPVAVTGAQTSEWVHTVGTTVNEEGVYHTRGPWWTVTWEADDPRLSGEGTWTVNWNFLLEDGPSIGTSAIVLANPDGRWVGTGQGFGDGSVDHELIVLRGEGDYDGLTATLLMRGDAGSTGFEGIIFPFEPPEIPDPIEPPAE